MSAERFGFNLLLCHFTSNATFTKTIQMLMITDKCLGWSHWRRKKAFERTWW